MCTVSFIPAGNKVFITSNRDEHAGRPLAVFPVGQKAGDVKIIYPQDAKAGGSWIAAKDNGDAIVLLNGGFIAHRSLEFYNKSRGLILLELANAGDPVKEFIMASLAGIEPFTVVIWHSNKLFDCRWDGHHKYQTELDASQPHIWSSATLYDHPAQQQRKRWFKDWLDASPIITTEEILHFHCNACKESRGSLVTSRPDGICTVSISSLQISSGEIVFNYIDLVKKIRHRKTMDILHQKQARPT